jgi:hypothetical protein
MANATSLIDIDVNSEAFRAFAQQFEAYSKLLTDSLSKWRAVNVEIGKTPDLIGKAAQAQERAERGRVLSSERILRMRQRMAELDAKGAVRRGAAAGLGRPPAGRAGAGAPQHAAHASWKVSDGGLPRQR